MENIEENQVTAGAAKADPMPASGVPVEDLGGPTPENYQPDDYSAKLKDPSSTLAQVKDVVNAKAMKAEEAETEEVVAEEETTDEETIEEEEKYDVEADVAALLEGEELSEDFQLATAADIVADPSAPDAFVNGIMEGKEWVWEGGSLREQLAEKTEKRINTLVTQQRLEEKKLSLFQDFLNNL